MTTPRTAPRIPGHIVFVLFCAYLLLAALPGAAQTGFDPGCPIPFGKLKSTGRPVDACTVDGEGSTDSQIAQNRAKNNLCITAQPVPVTQLSFVKLQAAVDAKHIPFGSASHIPEDRSVLHALYTTTLGDTIGEGTLVTYVGYVLDAHFSDVSSGESVNCKMLGKINNDIHVTLAGTPTANPCSGIVAEIIPHFRPLAWEDITTMNHAHPVRIVGQLFFDASHTPCRSGKAASPPRISIWEIHPVYSIDVCKETTPSQCQGNDPASWVPLEQVAPSSKRALDEAYR
jgi:hypothetical protein